MIEKQNIIQCVYDKKNYIQCVNETLTLLHCVDEAQSVIETGSHVIEVQNRIHCVVEESLYTVWMKPNENTV